MKLRPRNEQKELSRTFRFKATSQAERIAETVATNLGKQQPKSYMIDKQKIKKIEKRIDALTLDPRHTEPRHIEPRNNRDTNNFGSIMSGASSSPSRMKGSQLRAQSTSKVQNPSRTMQNSIQTVRHASVVPYNKSRFAKRAPPDMSRTFFKGATEYMIATGTDNSLADNDHALKKILDDSKV